jgi:hypothetical protein
MQESHAALKRHTCRALKAGQVVSRRREIFWRVKPKKVSPPPIFFG